MSNKAGGQLFIGQIVLYAAVILVGFWVATQYIAHQFRYHPNLGEPLLRFDSFALYPFYDIGFWLMDFYSHGPKLFAYGFLIIMGSVFLAVLGSYPLSLYRERLKGESNTYGSARFATLQDIKKTCLLDDKGMFIAKLPNGYYLRHDGPQNCWVIAPPRSGKGVGPIISSLLAWTESTLLYEVRSEAWSETSGFRSKFSHCFYFNPTDPSSCHFNPLLEVRKGPREMGDIQNIADVMVDPNGQIHDRSHWQLTSFNLLVCLLLHTLYAGKDKTLAGAAQYLSSPGEGAKKQIQAILYTHHLGHRPHPKIASIAQEVLNKAEGEFTSVVSTTMSYFNLYRDPIVAELTSKSDFKVRDLMHHDRPMSLYLAIPPSDSARTKPLLRLIMNQIIRGLTSDKIKPGATEKHYQHRLLMILDEFPELGKLGALQDSIAYLGGYGIKTMLSMQGLDQLDQVYGPNHSFASSIDLKLIYAANDLKTAEAYSKLSGTKTEQRTQTNYAGNRISLWLGHKMVATQETARPLITAGEILQLPEDEALLFMPSVPPIKAHKFAYYKEPIFADRMLPEMSLERVNGHYPHRIDHTVEWSKVIEPTWPKKTKKAKKKKEEAQASPQQNIDFSEEAEATTPEINNDKEQVMEPDRIDADDDMDNITAEHNLEESGWTI